MNRIGRGWVQTRPGRLFALVSATTPAGFISADPALTSPNALAATCAVRLSRGSLRLRPDRHRRQ